MCVCALVCKEVYGQYMTWRPDIIWLEYSQPSSNTDKVVCVCHWYECIKQCWSFYTLQCLCWAEGPPARNIQPREGLGSETDH